MSENTKTRTSKVDILEKKLEERFVKYDKSFAEVEARLDHIDNFLKSLDVNPLQSVEISEFRKDLDKLKKRFDIKQSEGISTNAHLKVDGKPALDAGDGKLRSRDGVVAEPVVEKRVQVKPIYHFK